MKFLIVFLCMLYYLNVVIDSKIVSSRARRSDDLIDIDRIDLSDDAVDEEDDGSGYEERGSSDFDDEEVSSGVGTAAPASRCETLRHDLNSNKLLGSFVPRCTPDGHFAPIQCHSSIGACWCVDKSGREILGSRKMAPDYPTCSGFASQTAATQRQPPGKSTVSARRRTTTMKSVTDDNGFWIQTTPESVESSKFDPNPKADTDTNVIGTAAESKKSLRSSFMTQPGILAGIIGGAVVGLLCAVLLIMFIVYRMKKKDYMTESKPVRSPLRSGYTKALDDKHIYT